mmetsp:Transcript_10782/g.21325  ORF Transcript_10782/g.21325 Transcript_10782/m.21325 type:complete len:125 (+) Transcript_10782:1599-1973(+)
MAVAVLPADDALDVEQRPRRILRRLTLRWLPHQPAFLGEGHPARGGQRSDVVREDLHPSVSPYADTRERRSQINANNGLSLRRPLALQRRLTPAASPASLPLRRGGRRLPVAVLSGGCGGGTGL